MAVTEMIPNSTWYHWNINIAENEEVEIYDTTNNDDPLIFSNSLLISFTVLLVILIIIGLLGNALVIFTLFCTRAYRATTTNAYIVNLSIADLLFLLFCVPFQGTVYILNDWPFGSFMCKATHFFQYWTMYASIWILTVMAVDRYLAIGHPLRSVDWRSPNQAMRVCCYIWTMCALFSTPWWKLYRNETYIKSDGGLVTACFDYWGEEMYQYRKYLFLFIFLTGFVLPSCIIFCMAILVARSLRNSTEQPILGIEEGENEENMAYIGLGHNENVSKSRRRVIRLVFGLSLIFFLCWFPQNASLMWLNFYTDIAVSIQKHYKIYFVIRIVSHMMTYINSTINPIMYGQLASGRFRSRLFHVLFRKNRREMMNRPGPPRCPIRSIMRNENGDTQEIGWSRNSGRTIQMSALNTDTGTNSSRSNERTIETTFSSDGVSGMKISHALVHNTGNRYEV